MDEHDFKWDPAKAEQNYSRHGVTFETTCGVFEDPLAIEFLDEREDYREDRFIIIGMVDERLLLVVYTLRGETIRIISARAAEPQERRRYHEDNA
jgi:uncharacterized DUF497 family protein